MLAIGVFTQAATSSFVILLSAPVGITTHILAGDAQWALIAPLALGGLVGGSLGPQIAAGTSYADAKKAGAVLGYGQFLTYVVNFMIVAFVLFIVVKALNELQKRVKAEKAAEAPPAYVLQLALYRALLQPLYRGRRIAAALLFTEAARLIELPDTALDDALARLTAA